MQLIPALDLHEGACVRLIRGDFQKTLHYAEDPLQVAQAWQQQGAKYLHVVDLDGARSGYPVHADIIGAIARLGIPFQVGGGIRTLEHVQRMLELGADRVILGTTSSVSGRLASLAQAFPGRVWASIDVDETDHLKVQGWLQGTQESGRAAARRCLNEGAAGLIFTATGQDGTLEGPRLPTYLHELEGPLIYAGGIGNYAHLRQLVRQAGSRLWGVIAGRALYDGCLELARAQEVMEEEWAHVDGEGNSLSRRS